MDKITGFTLGVDDYLTKPFSPAELMLRIKAVLRRYRKGRGEEEILKYGKVAVNLKTREVLKNGRPVELGFNISGKEHGNELKIKKIIFAKTITKIEGEIRGDDLFEEAYAIIAENKINFKSVSVDNQSHKINL